MVFYRVQGASKSTATEFILKIAFDFSAIKCIRIGTPYT